MSPFHFDLLAEDPSGARLGRFHTPHGAFDTPIFMPVATRASLKAITSQQLLDTRAEIILGNAYHLMQRPGHEVIAALGGLHKFMNWPRPILTDSGGFQVFSLAANVKLDEDGVTFRSEIDGSLIRLTPERVIEVEAAIGADIIMPLDHCIGFPAAKDDVARAVERTIRWAEQSVRAKTRDDQALFAIVQGGVHADLRVECAQALSQLDLPGYACGGFLVGEEKAATWEMLRVANAALPVAKPRYVMGIGTPLDFVDAVAAGSDMMDCVLPSRNARHGSALTRDGTLRMKNASLARDERPIDDACSCYTCVTHSRAYIRHLIHVGEVTGATLLTIHNIAYMMDVVHDTRDAIRAGQFAAHRAALHARLASRAVAGERDE